jgi:glycosyltransferase involved in cell wall biosynthesis
MRITIDATTLILPSAGVKNYVYYWLRSLAVASPARGDIVKAYPPFLDPFGALNHQRAGLSVLASSSLSLVHLSNLRGSPLLEWLLRGADLFHCSQHTARRPKRIKTTATIFDFSCWTRPETHTPQNVAATKRYAENILKDCDGLIAISSHARQDAYDILGIPIERIRVIYPGVAAEFFEVTDAQTEAVRAAYNLSQPYFLFVGCIEPRKNIRGLIAAYNALPENLRRDVPLVIAGPVGWESDAIRPLLLSKGVRYLGYVPEGSLPALFRAAAAFVYPSYYEGFGLPVAQAMAAGIPVITSNRSCLPEVVGDAGLTVDPDSTGDLAEALERVLTSTELTRELRSRGRARAQSYQWQTAANASLDFFHEVLQDN